MSSVLFFILTDNIRRVHSNERPSWKTWHWWQRNCHFDSGWKNGTWCWKRTVKGAAVHRSFFFYPIICTCITCWLLITLTDCHSNIKRVWIYINYLFFANVRCGCVGLLLSHKWLAQKLGFEGMQEKTGTGTVLVVQKLSLGIFSGNKSMRRSTQCTITTFYLFHKIERLSLHLYLDL